MYVCMYVCMYSICGYLIDTGFGFGGFGFMQLFRESETEFRKTVETYSETISLTNLVNVQLFTLTAMDKNTIKSIIAFILRQLYSASSADKIFYML